MVWTFFNSIQISSNQNHFKRKNSKSLVILYEHNTSCNNQYIICMLDNSGAKLYPI